MNNEIRKEDLVREMVREFNAYPVELVKRACIGDDYQYMDSFIDITKRIENEYVVYPVEGTIEEIDRENGRVKVEGEWFEESEIEGTEDGGLPMWDTMWQTDSLDYKIRTDSDFLYKLSEIGFTIYDTDFGIVLGIDGCGYDFYDHHWSPLYDLLMEV